MNFKDAGNIPRSVVEKKNSKEEFISSSFEFTKAVEDKPRKR